MKEFEYYTKTNTPYPFEKDYVTFQVNSISKGKIIHCSITEKELLSLTLNLKTVSKLESSSVQGDFLVIYKFDSVSYKARIEKYSQEFNKKDIEFKNDLAIENNIVPCSKLSDVIYSEAYERGHSAGHSEVASYYSSMSHFANEIIKATEKDLVLN
jgi:hypothetical protein